MGYKIKSEEENRRTVSFHMEAEAVSSLFKEVRREIQRDLVVPGFRKGRIPPSILQQRYGNLILSEVAEKAHQRLSDALFDENDWILSDAEPEFEPVLPVEGKDYGYEVTYTLFETPAPVDYNGIVIEVPPSDPERDLEETLNRIRERLISYEPVQRPAAEGDMVVVEYPSRDGSETRRAALVIGRENMGPGFDRLITGLSAGEGITARMEFPEADELPAPTRFTVSEVREPRVPEFNDEFAASAGGFKDMGEMREKLAENIGEKHRAELQAYRESVAVDTLLSSNEFKVPGFMVENLARDYMQRLEEEATPETEGSIRELAERKVREFLILRKIGIMEGIQISGEEIEKAAGQGSRSSALDRIRNEKALELVLSRAVEKEAEHTPESEDKNDSPSWRWKPVDDQPRKEE